MLSNQLLTFLIFLVIELTGFRTGLMLILHKDALWQVHARNSRLSPQDAIKPAIWDTTLNVGGAGLIIGCLLLLTHSLPMILGL